ncbi:MAG: hypothetical protein NC453_05150 [Muribaculum sp.]|nr:hypothetical protein [Muribaculum sp.]
MCIVSNRDGIDIDCCKYLTITNCRVNTPHDYALVLKSSYVLKKAVLCEHIAVANCNITGYKCDSLCSIIVAGMAEEPIHNVWLNNIRLHFRGGGAKELVSKAYREQGTNYPEPKFAGQTPACGLYARHVIGLHADDLTFT